MEKAGCNGVKNVDSTDLAGDDVSQRVYGVGISESVALLIAGQVAGYRVWDTHGNEGILIIAGIGGGLSTSLFPGMAYFEQSELDTIFELSGFGFSLAGDFPIVSSSVDFARGGPDMVHGSATSISIPGLDIGFSALMTHSWLFVTKLEDGQ